MTHGGPRLPCARTGPPLWRGPARAFDFDGSNSIDEYELKSSSSSSPLLSHPHLPERLMSQNASTRLLALSPALLRKPQPGSSHHLPLSPSDTICGFQYFGRLGRAAVGVHNLVSQGGRQGGAKQQREDGFFCVHAYMHLFPHKQHTEAILHKSGVRAEAGLASFRSQLMLYMRASNGLVCV